MLLIFAMGGFFLLTGCDKPDKGTESANEILQTDRDFSAFSKENGIPEAFLAFADEKSVLLRDHGYPLVGKEALRKHMEKTPSDNLIMTWEPLFAEASKAGDLGYSYGTFEISLAEKPEETVANGCYVSIWKRQDDGTWKWVLDAGSQGLEEEVGGQTAPE